MSDVNTYTIDIDGSTYEFDDQYVRAEVLLNRAARLYPDTSNLELRRPNKEYGFRDEEVINLEQVDSLVIKATYE
ncbi:MAG: hypothetical protein ABEN55_04115 [Bradymonadaceae bacterium]